MAVLLKGFRLHCAVMIILYICQGIAQGTLQIMILLLLQEHPELSAADQATLALPMYSFSLKFLWAPFVDHYYRKCACRDRRRESCMQSSPPCAGYHCLDESPTKGGSPACRSPAMGPAASPTAVKPRPVPHRSLFHRMHRRVQWVVMLELVMGATYGWLGRVGDDAYLEDIVKNRTVFWQFFFILCILSFANATQDVAVDAWAVEGLDRAHVSTAGMLQLVGVTIGVSLANIFVPLRSQFPHIFTLYGFFLVSGCLCAVCALLAAFLAWHRRLFNEHRLELEAEEAYRKQDEAAAAAAAATPMMAAKAPEPVLATAATPTEDGLATPLEQLSSLPPGEGEAVAMAASTTLYRDIVEQVEEDDEEDGDEEEHTSIMQTLRDIVATEGLRELVSIYLTRGWPLAVFPLVVSRLISMRVVSAGAVARYRIYSTIAQVTVAAYASVPLLRHVQAARVVQYVSGFDFLLNIGAALCFVLVAVPAAASWFGTAVVLPVTVLLFGVGAFSFVANVSLQGRFAHLFPRDVGGVLSLLAAISNMGHHLPGTFCLYAASVVVKCSTWFTGHDTRYATYYTTTKHGSGDSSADALSRLSSAEEVHEGAAGLSPYWVKMDVIACSIFFFGSGVLLRYVFLVPASSRLTQITANADARRSKESASEDPSQPLLHI